MSKDLFGALGVHRRSVLAGVPAAMAMGLGACATSHSAPDATSDRTLASLRRYAGVYDLGDGRMVGIQPFINDAGEAVLLLADYSTSVVRPLRPTVADLPDPKRLSDSLAYDPPTGEGIFTAGPSFDAPRPVEMRITFWLNAQKQLVSLTLGSEAAYGTGPTANRIATRDEEISFSNADARLSGTLTMPPGRGPHPAIILLHGSGPLTRYSFGPNPRFFSSLGLAVLVYDKRGTGSSTGRRLDSSTGAPETLWPEYFPDDILADALAAHRFLQGRRGIDAKRIGFWGASEGGMLATQVAARSSDVAFAINSSGFMGPLWKTILYQGAAMMRAAGKPDAEIEEAVAFNRLWMDVARTGEGYDEYLERREAIRASGKTGWFFYTFAETYSSLEQMRWSWSHVLAFDSSVALPGVNCPVLGMFGAADVLTDASAASAVMRGALRNVSTHIIPNGSHSLMETPSRKGMAPGVFDALRTWLLPVVR